MTINNKQIYYTNILNSAFNCIEKAVDTILTDPHFSTIHFFMGVELFFKARLFKEHWTLIFENIDQDDVNYDSFKTGKFKTVTFDKAAKRIRKLLNDLSKGYEGKFEDLRLKRNILMHFPYENLHQKDHKKNYINIQCKTWFHLHFLLKKTWYNSFKDYPDYDATIDAIEIKMKEQKHFYDGKYSDLVEKNKNKYGNDPNYKNFADCKCIFCSTENNPGILFERNNFGDFLYILQCEVCENTFPVLFLKSENAYITNHEDNFKCIKSNKEYSLSDIRPEFEPLLDPKEASSAILYAYCEKCETQNVLCYNEPYICLNCFDTPNYIIQCENCGDYISTDDDEEMILYYCQNCSDISMYEEHEYEQHLDEERTKFLDIRDNEIDSLKPTSNISFPQFECCILIEFEQNDLSDNLSQIPKEKKTYFPDLEATQKNCIDNLLQHYLEYYGYPTKIRQKDPEREDLTFDELTVYLKLIIRDDPKILFIWAFPDDHHLIEKK